MPNVRKRPRSGNTARRPRTRRRRITKRVRMPMPMRPRTYYFTRSFVETLDLNGTTPPTGWTAVANGLCRSQPFDLSLLPQNSEFINLFAQYRLLAVKQEYYFCDTASVNFTDGTYNNSGNKQILMYTNPNAVGVNNVGNLTEDFFMQSQSCKKRTCLHANGKPIRLYTKLKQLTDVYSGEIGNTDYVKSYPKFVSTTEPRCQHYGIDVRLQRVDNQAFSFGGSVYPKVKIITKIYLQCRQVK